MTSKVVLNSAILFIATVSLVQFAAGQEVHVVGDSLGWIVPPLGSIAYRTWADLQTFTAGDILVFNFTTGQQDVARVTREAFDSCSSTNPLSLQTTGPANYTLSSAGEYYFISTLDRHCSLGQKLAINVTAAEGPTPPPAPPTTPVPGPPRSPVTYVVGDELGWLVPPGGAIAYSTWAYAKEFVAGDTLVFNFTTGEQDVARVTREAFDSCNSTNPLSLQTTGPVYYRLSSAGEYYFISTLDRHCSLGQKLAINVTAAEGPTPSPAPPTTPVPPPPWSPVTYVVGDELGWLVPPGGAIAYSTWAYGKHFVVGDTLVFNFTNGTQDVAEVSKSHYETCDTNNTIRVFTISPVRITLTMAGEHFYTSTYSRHCALGQRLAINVTAAALPPPSTIAMPPDGASAPSPQNGPAAGGPSPPPSSSATTYRGAAGAFCITLLSIVVAVLYA